VTFRVRYTKAARDDLRRRYTHLLERDPPAVHRARNKIAKGVELLKEFPFTCRKASPDSPFLRELVISFGSSGYVMLFEIEDAATVTILAVRHQREDDYL
jgi:plasmid stabilization system protein ParE